MLSASSSPRHPGHIFRVHDVLGAEHPLAGLVGAVLVLFGHLIEEGFKVGTGDADAFLDFTLNVGDVSTDFSACSLGMNSELLEIFETGLMRRSGLQDVAVEEFEGASDVEQLLAVLKLDLRPIIADTMLRLDVLICVDQAASEEPEALARPVARAVPVPSVQPGLLP
jgi:hypothetical protein